MSRSVCIGLLLLSLYGCSTVPQALPEPLEVDTPIPVKLLELCKPPKQFLSSRIQELIITSVDNTEKHINCFNRHNVLVEVLKNRQ